MTIEVVISSHQTRAALSVGGVLVGAVEVVALVLQLLLERHDDVVVQALTTDGLLLRVYGSRMYWAR